MAAYIAFSETSAPSWRLTADLTTSALTDAVGASRVTVGPPPRTGDDPATWTVRTDGEPGDVCLPTVGTGIRMDVPLETSARITAALRRLMPDAADLVFCDQGYYFHVPVPPGVTAEELLAAVDEAE